MDTAVLVLAAFGGTQAPATLLRMIFSAYLIKVLVEVVATPLTYLLVARLKSAESANAFDTRTSFNPFAWQEERA